MINKIKEKDFERCFEEELTSFLKEKIKDFDLSYENLNKQENNDVILKILSYLYKDTEAVVQAGQHRLNDWENGWQENAEEFLKHKEFNFLIPKYFGKYPYIRWNKEIIRPCNKDMEYSLVNILQYWIFEKFLKDCLNIYEFGCGTGHNLLRVKEVNPEAQIFGLDWSISSQQSIANINKVFNTNFNTILMNVYKNGLDNISLHKDKEVGWVKNTGFLTLSFGAERDFQIKEVKTNKINTILHKNGMGILMDYPMNDFYLHGVPVRKKVKDTRISLTFREIEVKS